jgi:hypothetical protein
MGSITDLATQSRSYGLSVEVLALLDRPDYLTKSIVTERTNVFSGLDIVDYGDLGLTRNAGAHLARGRFLTFLDGDDLWSDNWVSASYARATNSQESSAAIWHPEYLYYFAQSDFDHHSQTAKPSKYAISHFKRHKGTDDVATTVDGIPFDNIWTANAFALTETFLHTPYRSKHSSPGFGIEDWSWNMETLWAGIEHRTVPETVHMIRIKDTPSLGQTNSQTGLLPHIPTGYNWPSKFSRAIKG